MTGRADAHVHLATTGRFSTAVDEGHEVETYDRARVRAAITDALVVGYQGWPGLEANNADVLAIARERSWVHPLAYLDVRHPPADDLLTGAAARGFRGFSVYDDPDGAHLADWPVATRRRLAAGGDVLSLNLRPAALARLAAVAGDLAGTTVLVSHLGLPGPLPATAGRAEVRDRLRPLLDLARFEHVSVKLSGLYAIDPVPPHAGALAVTEEVLGAFGPGRLLWGSDFSPALDVVGLDDALTLPAWLPELATPAEIDDIGGATLRRLLAAPPTGRTAP
ncbi:amidohydrolase family protein [Georgenia faecalis]|uniref:Amidohydrolase family protein n=1 Tax=Georgenia faecalis TaxID=2483799 RepID=A0ABV9D8B8_9MICO|nr:amidohydrolase family protein [Georgenia faecalis]